MYIGDKSAPFNEPRLNTLNFHSNLLKITKSSFIRRTTMKHIVLPVFLPLLLVISTGCANSKKPAMPEAPPLTEQQMMEAWEKSAAAGPEHKTLSSLAGAWKAEAKFWNDPKKAPEIVKAKATFTSVLGGRYIRQDYSGKLFGKPMHGIGYMGYDNSKKTYSSTWMDTNSTSVMSSTGTYDAASKTWTFLSEMSCPFAANAMVQMTEKLTLVGKNHLRFEMYQSRDGGEPQKSFEINYRR